MAKGTLCVIGLILSEDSSSHRWFHRCLLWITDCAEHHGTVCTDAISTASISGMAVIDCDTVKVVHADSSMRWAVLSYRWGPPLEPDTPIHDICYASATVRDAMSITRSLGYRYLWVDKYCINQQNSEECDDQIGKMDLIYRNAEFIIIAAAGPDEHYGLPGVGSTPRVEKNTVVQVGEVTVMSTGPDPAFHVKSKSSGGDEHGLSRNTFFLEDASSSPSTKAHLNATKQPGVRELVASFVSDY